MNWEAISALGQIIGAMAVVISVIYLALQVRSNARQTRLASMRSMSDAFNGFLQGLAGNPQMGELWYRGVTDYESIQGVDLPRYNALIDHLFRILRRHVLPEPGRTPGSASVVRFRSAHARYYRIPWNPRLVAIA